MNFNEEDELRKAVADPSDFVCRNKLSYIIVFTLSRHIFFILNEPNIYI